jgi:hypothetical protein
MPSLQRKDWQDSCQPKRRRFALKLAETLIVVAPPPTYDQVALLANPIAAAILTGRRHAESEESEVPEMSEDDTGLAQIVSTLAGATLAPNLFVTRIKKLV